MIITFTNVIGAIRSLGEAAQVITTNLKMWLGFETSETLGTEEVVNGDFATDSNWTKGTGWTISNGNATLVSRSGSSSLASTNMSLTAGKTYKVTVNVIATSSGFRLYDTLGVVSYGLSIGENVFYRTLSSNTYGVTPLGLSGASGIISNVSVKELTQITPDKSGNNNVGELFTGKALEF